MTAGMKWLAAAGVVVVLAALFVWRIEADSTAVLARVYPQPPQPLRVAPQPAMAPEGMRLAHVDGCYECHGKALTGHVEYTGWFGSILTAPNLTRVAQHATAQQLAAAIRFGVTPHGHSIFSMPVHRFLEQSDADNAAIIAFLQSLKPLPDVAPQTHWGFDGRVMLALGLIPAAATSAKPADRGPLTTPAAPMALGAYITHVQCAACHGPDLSGEAEEHSPDLRFAIKHYSLPAFEHFFRTGEARLGHGSPVMTALIKRRFHDLTEGEVRAIFVYLNNSKASG